MLRRNLLLAGAAAVSLAGCAVHKQFAVDDFDPYYAKGSVKSVAVLPVANGAKVEEYLNRINQTLAATLKSNNPDVTVLSADEVVRKISEAGESAAASRLSAALQKGGVPETASLEPVQKILGTDALLFCEFTELHQNDGVFFRGRGHARIKASLRLINFKTGQLIWSGNTMEWFATSNFGIHKAPPFTQPMEETLKKFEAMMPRL